MLIPPFNHYELLLSLQDCTADGSFNCNVDVITCYHSALDPSLSKKPYSLCRVLFQFIFEYEESHDPYIFQIVFSRFIQPHMLLHWIDFLHSVSDCSEASIRNILKEIIKAFVAQDRVVVNNLWGSLGKNIVFILGRVVNHDRHRLEARLILIYFQNL